MNVQLETMHRIMFVVPHGRLDFGASESFQGYLDRAIAEGGGVVIDCAALDYVSSAGLRVFLVAVRNAKRTGVTFAVCNLKPVVREVFEISGFGRLMTVYADRAAAVAQMAS